MSQITLTVLGGFVGGVGLLDGDMVGENEGDRVGETEGPFVGF